MFIFCDRRNMTCLDLNEEFRYVATIETKHNCSKMAYNNCMHIRPIIFSLIFIKSTSTRRSIKNVIVISKFTITFYHFYNSKLMHALLYTIFKCNASYTVRKNQLALYASEYCTLRQTWFLSKRSRTLTEMKLHRHYVTFL